MISIFNTFNAMNAHKIFLIFFYYFNYLKNVPRTLISISQNYFICLMSDKQFLCCPVL